MKEVPIWEKSNLSLEEAAAYSGIGVNKLRELYFFLRTRIFIRQIIRHNMKCRNRF